MKKLSLLISFATAMGAGVAMAQKPSDRSVVRLDPALDGLVSPDAKLELVKGGFGLPRERSGSRKAKVGICCSAISPPM
jgi:hypothetical protein